jgi:tryptophan-rich sensory protein
VAGLIFWLALCFAAESSAVVCLPGRWYAHLNKAFWTPPSYLFGPVWTALYIVMAVAAWLVWRDGGFARNPVPLGLFLAQLALNSAWSFICFRVHNLPVSVLDMSLLWLTLLATTRAFWKTKPIAGWLMLPCALWVSFAASLNFALWWLNA